MRDLIFLCHRIPYPPNKGDKIRSYHILKELSGQYNVHIAMFIDDPEDKQHVSHVSGLCESLWFREINPSVRKMVTLPYLFSTTSLTEAYYKDSGLRSWLKDKINDLDNPIIFVFSSALAQYVMSPQCSDLVRIIDFVDMDSDKWCQYSKKSSFATKLIYRRECDLLRRYESRIASEFDRSYFVSPQEAELFTRHNPMQTSRIGYFNNGVDLQYFDPSVQVENPYSENKEILVFTGAMDYWANVDAVTWFVSEVFPRIRTANPKAEFYIVGSNPSSKVQRLDSVDGVHVTGRVEDVRPYISYAKVVVAPMRIARGVQNKVLEAMAMAKTVVTTSAGYEGIAAESGVHLYIEDNAQQMADLIARLLSDVSELKDMGWQARQRIVEAYSWHASLKPLIENLDVHANRK